MAFSLKVTSEINGSEGQSVENSPVDYFSEQPGCGWIEPKWWDKKELQELHEFKQEIDHGYIDYVLEVNKAELQQISNKYAPLRESGTYSYEAWVKINRGTQKEIDRLIKKLRSRDVVRIVIFEWETGY